MTVKEQLSGNTAGHPNRLSHCRVTMWVSIKLEGPCKGFLEVLIQSRDQMAILYLLAVMPLNHKLRLIAQLFLELSAKCI